MRKTLLRTNITVLHLCLHSVSSSSTYRPDSILSFLFAAETDVLVPVFSQSTDVVVVVLKFPIIRFSGLATFIKARFQNKNKRPRCIKVGNGLLTSSLLPLVYIYLREKVILNVATILWQWQDNVSQFYICVYIQCRRRRPTDRQHLKFPFCRRNRCSRSSLFSVNRRRRRELRRGS